MSVIDDWIAQLSAAKISDSSQPLESTVATAIAALTAIQLALAAPPGPEPAHTFLAGPLGGGPANPTFRLIDVTDLPGGSLINQFRVPFGSATGSLTTSPNFLFGSVDAQLVVSENAGVPTVAAPPGTVLHLIGSDANAAFLDIDGYGNGSPTILTQRANGTAALPTPIPATATLMNFQINGYGATGYFNGPNIIAQATENWNDASHGSRLRFSTVKNGTAIVAPALAIENDGSINIGNLAGTFGAADARLYVNNNVATVAPLAGGTIAHFLGADNASPGVTIDGFSNLPTLSGRRAQGTGVAPSATLLSNLMQIGASGYGATGYAPINRVSMNFTATENWTDAAQGTALVFNTTRNGSVTTAAVFTIGNDGSLSAPGNATTAAVLKLSGPAGTFPAAIISSFGAATPVVIGQGAQGTPGAPTHSLNGDALFTLTSNGRGATAITGNTATIQYTASQDFTDTAWGTDILFATTGLNQTVSDTIQIIKGDGTIIQRLSVLKTVATLPVADAAHKGARIFVTDGNAPVFAAAVVGGGAIFTPVYCDGVTWRCG